MNTFDSPLFENELPYDEVKLNTAYARIGTAIGSNKFK